MLDVRRPTRTLSRLAVLAVLVWLPWGAPPLTHAQQAPAPDQGAPVFRGGVEFVSVDVFPRRDGRVIEGLRVEDFELLEDGTPQQVENFEFVRIEASPLDSERRDPTSRADGDRQAADPRNRVWVVYLDLAHTTVAGSYQARSPVVEFLKRTIGARDLFGVMTAEVPAAQLAFGRRIDTIENELASYWTWGRSERVVILPRTPYENRLQSCAMFAQAEAGQNVERLLFSLHWQDQLMTSLENLMMRLGGLRDERKNILFVSEGWVPQRPNEALRNFSVSGGRVPQIGVGPGGRIGVGQTMSGGTGDTAWCDTEVARLAAIDFETRFRRLLTEAGRANVSFYPVDVGGLRTEAPAGGPMSTLQTLAENTDGFAVINTNDLNGAVRRIEADLSSYYLLGYYSNNPRQDGQFRRIEVRVKQQGVRVSARRGYFSMTPAMAAAAASAGTRTAPTAADAALARLATVRADADLFVSGTARPAGLDVSIEVSAAAVRREGWAGGTTVQVRATGSGGQSATATAEIAPGQRATRVSLAATEIGAGPWEIVATAEGRGGRLEQRAEVDALEAAIIGEPQAFRGTASPRSPLQPVADARLSRLERLRVEWPVVAPPDTQVARLLDRTGKPLGQPLPLATLPADRQAVAIDLPLGALPEGEYMVELVATRGDVSERRLLAFRVTR